MLLYTNKYIINKPVICALFSAPNVLFKIYQEILTFDDMAWSGLFLTNLYI